MKRIALTGLGAASLGRASLFSPFISSGRDIGRTKGHSVVVIGRPIDSVTKAGNPIKVNPAMDKQAWKSIQRAKQRRKAGRYVW